MLFGETPEPPANGHLLPLAQELLPRLASDATDLKAAGFRTHTGWISALHSILFCLFEGWVRSMGPSLACIRSAMGTHICTFVLTVSPALYCDDFRRGLGLLFTMDLECWVSGLTKFRA